MSESLISETARISFERTLDYAVLGGLVAWVIHSFIFVTCVHTIIRNGDKGARKWLLLVAPLYLLCTTNIVLHRKFNQLAWITYRNYPGGPLAFFVEQQSDWINLLASASAILALSGTSFFMVHRHYTQTKQRFTTVLLFLLLILHISTSISLLVRLGRSSSDLDGFMPKFIVPCGPLVDFAIWYWPIWAASRAVIICKKRCGESSSRESSSQAGTTPIPFDFTVMLVLLSFVDAEIGFLWNTGANTFIVVPLYVQVACIYVEMTIMRKFDQIAPAEIALPSPTKDVSHPGDVESR